MAKRKAVARPPRDPASYRQPTPHSEGAIAPIIAAELLPQHVAIVMDGNGRWANQRGLPRTRGHEMGEQSLLAVVHGALEIGVPCRPAYAFATAKWKRPPEHPDAQSCPRSGGMSDMSARSRSRRTYSRT